MPAPPITPERIEQIRRTYAGCGSMEKTAHVLGTSRNTVRKYVRSESGPAECKKTASGFLTAPRLPDPMPEAGGPALPEPVTVHYAAYDASDVGIWGVLSDVHIPYHDRPTIERWVAECKKSGVVGLLLNGDILDCYQLSDFVRDPSAPRIKEEIEKGRQFLEYLRSQFPRVRIIYKEGNHDLRLKTYLANRAPELFDLDDIQLPRLLRTESLGVEWVGDKRIVQVGKLPVIHGHEYRGGGGVMPARWLYLRTGESALMGHFHQPTFYSFRTMMGKEVGMWSVGCACYLSPQYAPLNQWAHGWAQIIVSNDGGYEVLNRRLLNNGQVV